MYKELKERHRSVRDAHPENLTLRVHRALSWLNASESTDDLDGKFIFLWIAFNAAYATEIDSKYRDNEQVAFGKFVGKLCDLDTQKRIEHLIWQEFSGAIRVLLQNRYIFAPYWEHQNLGLTDDQWKTRFHEANTAANTALGSGTTNKLVSIILSRIYTLRNQLVHGGSTWGGKVNRTQLQDCTNIMNRLVPIIIQLMMENPNTLWGDPCFPVVER